MNNKMVLKGMIRLSGIIKSLKEGRCKLNLVAAQTEYFIVQGDCADALKEKTTQSIHNCLYVEQYLRLSVSDMCSYLDGFDLGTMDPIDYVSSSDVKNKFIDICRGKKVVANIDLQTGTITRVKPECIAAEDKCPAEKS